MLQRALTVGGGGGKGNSGTIVMGSSDVVVPVGFEPKKILVCKLSDGGSTEVGANSVSLIYDSDNDSSNQYRMLCSTKGSTANVSCLPCPTTVYSNCIKDISSTGFTFNATNYQGTYYWSAVG